MAPFFRINQRIDEKLLTKFEDFLNRINADPSIKKDADIILWFCTRGGESLISAKIIEKMNETKFKFFGIAYREVHSAAVQIFLSTHVRFGYKEASALIHRAQLKNEGDSESDLKKIEKQVFETISEKLDISLGQVYQMANKKTLITMDHPLSKKFFIGS